MALAIAFAVPVALAVAIVDWSELNDDPQETEARQAQRAPQPRDQPGEPLIGVQLHPFFDDQTPATVTRELDLAASTGSQVVRADVNWSSLQIEGPRAEPGYAERIDGFLAQARERGLGVILTVVSTPCWASSAPESLKQGCSGRWWQRGVTSYPPADPGTLADVSAYIARRWGAGLAALEIWNEPNYELFLESDEPARDYGRMLRATYPAVKRERPDLPVLAGSFAEADEDFLEQLYDDGGIRGSYDGMAWHPYTHPNSPRAPEDEAGTQKAFADGAAALRRIMRRNGDERAELWATEAGATTCREGIDERCVDAATQARWIRDYVEVAREVPGLRALVIYNLRDKGTNPDDVEHGFGLVRRDFSPKPALDAFRSAVGAKD